MFVLSSISSGLEFLSVNHSSIYQNSELKNWIKHLITDQGTNVYNTLKSC